MPSCQCPSGNRHPNNSKTIPRIHFMAITSCSCNAIYSNAVNKPAIAPRRIVPVAGSSNAALELLSG